MKSIHCDNGGDMTEDIRDKANINHEDVIGLNFIRASGAYVFRKYYNQGLLGVTFKSYYII